MFDAIGRVFNPLMTLVARVLSFFYDLWPSYSGCNRAADGVRDDNPHAGDDPQHQVDAGHAASGTGGQTPASGVSPRPPEDERGGHGAVPVQQRQSAGRMPPVVDAVADLHRALLRAAWLDAADVGAGLVIRTGGRHLRGVSRRRLRAAADQRTQTDVQSGLPESRQPALPGSRRQHRDAGMGLGSGRDRQFRSGELVRVGACRISG